MDVNQGYLRREKGEDIVYADQFILRQLLFLPIFQRTLKPMTVQTTK